MKLRYAILTILVCMLIALSCKDNSSSTDPDPDPPDPPENPDLVSEDIGPDGGEIISKDGKLTLTIPAGALGNTETITIEPINPDELGAEFDGIDAENAWELRPDGLTFNQPITVQFETDQTPTPDDTTLSVAPELLLISDGETVEPLDSLRVEAYADNGTVMVSGQLKHFSILISDNIVSDNIEDGGVGVDIRFDVTLPSNSKQVVNRRFVIHSYLFDRSEDISENPPFYEDRSLKPIKIVENSNKLPFLSASDTVFTTLSYSRSVNYTCESKGTGEYRAQVSVSGELFPTQPLSIYKNIECIEGGTVKGNVTLDNIGIEGIRVFIDKEVDLLIFSRELIAETFTDEDGYYSFENIFPGEIEVAIEHTLPPESVECDAPRKTVTVEEGGTNLVDFECFTEQSETAPTIDKVEGQLTSPFGAKFTLSGRFNGDLSNLSVLFSPDDGNEDIVIEPENLPEIEDGFKAVIDHLFNEEAAFPINPVFFTENTQTGESDSESFEVDKVTLTVKKNGTGKGTVTASDTTGFEFINCDPNCQMDSANSIINPSFFISFIELVAEASPNSIFLGWSDETGECKGTDPCFLSVNEDHTIIATFGQDTSTISADLSFSFLETDSPVGPGENTPVKVTVTNNGPDDADAEQTSIMLEMSSGQITETPENLECEEAPAEEINCNILDDLIAGSEEEFAFTIVIEGTGEHLVDGTISFDGEDPDESNNTDEMTIIVEEDNTGSDACVQPFGLNGEQALGLRFMTTNIAGFLGSFVNVECAGSNILQVSGPEDSAANVDITCTNGDCGKNNIVNGTELACSVETTFGNQSFFFDCFESTNQGDVQKILFIPIGTKPQPEIIIAGNTYTYEAPNLIVNEGMPERCGSGFNDSDARGVGDGLDFEAANGTLSGRFGGQDTAFEGPYSSVNGLWEAQATLPFGSEGGITRSIEGIFQQQLDGPIVIVGKVTVAISDPGGQLDGCTYSGLGEITNRE